MKKSTITLAVAAALAASAAAQAETTLYGSVRVGIQWTNQDIEVEDVNSPGDIADTISEGVWAVKDESSRWGIKGSEDLGNGLSAIYQIEWGFNTADNNGGLTGREQWVGLGGGWGRVRAGTTESPYYTVAGRVDVFLSSFWNYSLMPNTRRNNALIYDLPGGLPVTGGVMINMNGLGEEADSENGIDEYSAGVNFNVGPFGAGVGYVSDENASSDAWVVSASVDFFGASIGGSWESGDFDDQGRSACGLASGNDDSDYYAIEAQYKFGNNIARAGWEQCNPDNADDANGWAIGLQHNLSSRTLVGLEFQDFDAYSDIDPSETAGDTQQAVLHFRHSF